MFIMGEEKMRQEVIRGSDGVEDIDFSVEPRLGKESLTVNFTSDIARNSSTETQEVIRGTGADEYQEVIR